MNRLSHPMGGYRGGEKKVSPNEKIIEGRPGADRPEGIIMSRISKSASVSGPFSKAIENTIRKYEEGRISLGRAAELSNVSYNKMIEEMKDRGVKIRFGPENIEEAEEEVKIIRTYLHNK